MSGPPAVRVGIEEYVRGELNEIPRQILQRGIQDLKTMLNMTERELLGVLLILGVRLCQHVPKTPSSHSEGVDAHRLIEVPGASGAMLILPTMRECFMQVCGPLFPRAPLPVAPAPAENPATVSPVG